MLWQVLKIDKLKLSKLNKCEDSCHVVECNELLKWLYRGNESICGLKFITSGCGINLRGLVACYLHGKRFMLSPNWNDCSSNPMVRSSMAVYENDNKQQKFYVTTVCLKRVDKVKFILILFCGQHDWSIAFNI